MTRKIKRALFSWTPAWMKVLVTQFGAGAAARAVILFVSCLSLFLMTVILVRPRMGWLITGACLGLQFWFFWRLRVFQLVGQIACACGCVRENLSQFRQAKDRFLVALKFLADRQKSYEGLFRIAQTEGDLRELARTIGAHEQPLSGELALLLGRCLRAAGDAAGALPSFELADRLAPSDTIRLELAEVYLTVGAADKCLQTVQHLVQPDGNGHCCFLRAVSLRLLGKPTEALLWANRAAQLRPCESDYQLEKGKILELLGSARAARRQYNKAIRVHSSNPEAYFRRALLSLDEGEWASATKDFEQCYYYENTCTEAYLLAQMAKDQTKGLLDELEQRNNPTWLQVEPNAVDLVKGDTTSVTLTICPESAVERCRVAALEPFGAGLEVHPREVIIGPITKGQMHTVELRVKAKRAHKVNLDNPWTLNLVFTSDGAWASSSIQYRVHDEDAGRVFFILTNDHEPRPRAGEERGTEKFVIEPNAFERDLVRVSEVANQLGKQYGFCWTHMLDAGGGVALPRWCAARNLRWGDVRNKVENHYRAAAKEGHDFQLHLHLSAIPESPFFCYGYDDDKGFVFFDLRRRNRLAEGKKVNSWSNVTPRYGKPNSVRSRTGSLGRTKNLVASVLPPQFLDYRPILFRAGQWDLGASLAEREKSVLALRENGLLADSSVTNRDHYGVEGPDFGKPPTKSCYFSRRNDPSKPAIRLCDAGLIEVVPIIQPQGRHPVSPRDDPKTVVRAYRSFVGNGKIKPGRHLLMEIEHLATMAGLPTRKIGDKPMQAGDWKLMNKHFAIVHEKCPALEGVGASEAICAWLDYYSPELVVRLERHSTCANGGADGSESLRFQLRFLGDGILTDEARVYRLVVPLPAGIRLIDQTIRVFEGPKRVLEAPAAGTDMLPLALILCIRNQNDFEIEIKTECKQSAFRKSNIACAPA